MGSEDENQREIYEYPLKIIWHLGIRPGKKSIILDIIFAAACLDYFILLFLSGTMMKISVINKDVYSIIDTLVGMTHIFQFMGKYIILYYKKHVLAELLEEARKFERYDEDLGRIMKNGTTFVKGFMVLVFTNVSLYILMSPVALQKLPIVIYQPNGWYYQELALFFFICPFVCASVWGTDALFCAFSIALIVQLKILERRIRNFDYRLRTKEDFTKLVIYHQFLIKFSGMLKSFIEEIFLVQYFISITAICTQTVVMTQMSPSLLVTVQGLGFLCSVILQTGIYCILAEWITEASFNIKLAIYESTWYKGCQNSFKKLLMVVLIRSQKEITFNSYGFVGINLGTFINIYKTAFTFFTYVHGLVMRE